LLNVLLLSTQREIDSHGPPPGGWSKSLRSPAILGAGQLAAKDTVTNGG